tara:strand:+ start:491 stop:2011 length:1521 start_codon:yes stop_codon:yes gene_type:complete
LNRFEITRKDISIDTLFQIIENRPKIILSKDVQDDIKKSRNNLASALGYENAIYGVNTGFGKLESERINDSDLNKLQENLIRSHAVGVGDYVEEDVCYVTLLLKIICMAKGFSGVRLELVEFLLFFINSNTIPAFPSQGSVGASGDLAPLAHMSLPILGEGNLWNAGSIVLAKNFLTKNRLFAPKLKYKEGLALINGTQFSTALAVVSLHRIESTKKIADVASAMALDALECSLSPFDNRIHSLKKHKGQIEVAENIRNLLAGSNIVKSHKNCDRVQDMYSIRCIPQVHGASRECIKFSYKNTEYEINAVSDNPIVIDRDNIVSAGNFHAEMIAKSLDVLGLAVSEYSNISERRIYNLVDGKYGLPLFLVKNPGINSGMMMAHVTAASLASENKFLSNPASTDTIPTSAGQEDHVSMAPIAGLKLLKSIKNLQLILSIELLCTSQAIDFRTSETSPVLNEVLAVIRSEIPFIKADNVVISNEIHKLNKMVGDQRILNLVSKEVNLL